MIFITIFVVSILATFLQVCAAPLQSRDNSLVDISQYLAAHNVVRLRHSAAPLTWSNVLAEAAQSWADGCNFKHSDGVLSDMSYGENIAASEDNNFGPTSAVEAFLGNDEATYNSASPSYTDFTQIVWQSTTRVGCAYNSHCGNIFPNSQATLHVCLYNPPGNVIGQTSDNVSA
jgi:pathogenesis-related protein 1